MAASFAEVVQLYKSTVSSVTDPRDYFSSDEYNELKRSAALVFDKVKPTCDTFIGIVQGLKRRVRNRFPGHRACTVLSKALSQRAIHGNSTLYT
ncbi:MAG: hypothetical protein FJ006_04485 [Chloroflexi bacterium]|nr:hypothetical protein [Chloroflexota bacterium]